MSAPHIIQKNIWKLISLGLVSVVAATASINASARLVCEEMVAQRECKDASSRVMEVKPGVSASIPPPHLSGYSKPCWQWSRKFVCLETEPEYSCESGTDFDTVKRDCNLTNAVLNATLTINGIRYITDADYTYHCAYGAYTANQELPPNMECVNLQEHFTYHDWVKAGQDNAVPSPTLPKDKDLALEEQKHVKYVCYADPVTVCSDTCYEQVSNPVTGQLEQVEVACTSPVDQCVMSQNNCNGTLATDENGFLTYNGLGPDGRCVDSTQTEMCRSGDVPRCLTNDQCQLTETRPDDIQSNGVALAEEQIYMCSNETTTCTEYATISNCVTMGAWGWDRHNLSQEAGKGLGEANQAMAQLEGLDKGLKNEDPFIFSGKDMRCHYAVGNFLNTAIMIVVAVALTSISGGALGPAAAGIVNAGPMATLVSAAASAAGATITATQAVAIGGAISAGMTFVQDAPNSKAFGANCCKNQVIEGSDKWYKLGSCSADEVRLSIAKVKGLSVYLGDYCSKKGGFPIKQCVQRTKTYCVFDDMLALTINEQGRAQLDQLASADTQTTTLSDAYSLQMYSPEPVGPVTEYKQLMTGKWNKIGVVNGSQLWYWQYPSYCASQEKQKVAYDLYTKYLDGLAEMKGIQPENMSLEQGYELIARMLDTDEYQECPAQQGMMTFMTCGLKNDNCREDALPTGPDSTLSDFGAGSLVDEDLNWKIQSGKSFYLPTDYGMATTVDGHPDFARAAIYLSTHITAQGSCHRNGDCRYQFSVSDKNANALGIRKRISETFSFPLYTITPNSSWPAIDYMDVNGNMPAGAYENDPQRGLGLPSTVSSQRFIFHPHFQTQESIKRLGNQVHNAILLEWAVRQVSWEDPRLDYTPLVLPTNLPAGTQGWYPYRSGDDAFYISGGCDMESRWCSYKVEVDLNVGRHPWGSVLSPRCWGFTVDQIAALDFDRMDLSKWINSLDLDSATSGMNAEAAKAMTEQTMKSAQSFYGAFKSGESVTNPASSTKALMVNSDTFPYLSGADYSAYLLEIAVPSNWPQYYDDLPNENPIVDGKVNWGDGSPEEPLMILANGRALYQSHDYGDKAPGAYKVTVTLQTTHNGIQVLSQDIRITPDNGHAVIRPGLDFSPDNSNAPNPSNYTPSEAPNGLSQAEHAIQQLSPGTVQQYQTQGDTITMPETTP